MIGFIPGGILAHPSSLKEQAIRMRMAGLTFSEIATALGISKSTASLWVRGVSLEGRGKDRLQARISMDNRLRMQSFSSGRKSQYQRIREDAFQAGLMSNPSSADALCVGLYWGEGSKSDKYWQFVNSDRDSVSQMVRWAIRAGQNPSAFRAKVQIHPGDEVTVDQIRDFWSEAGIPSQNIKVYRLRTPSSKLVSRRRTPFGTCCLSTVKNGALLFSYYEGQKEALCRH